MEIPQHWRLNAQRYALTGSVCEACGTAHFPPRAVCDVCAEVGEMEPQADAVAATVVSEAPARRVRSNGRVGVGVGRLAATPT